MHIVCQSSCYNSQHATTCKRSFKIRGPASKHAHKSSLQRHRSPGSGTRKTKHTEEEKKKKTNLQFAKPLRGVCGVWCVVCGVLWCGVGHSTRRRVSSISETCIRLGLFRALGQAKYQLGSYQSALLLVACRSINIPLPLSLSLSLPLLPSLSVLSVCK